MSITLTEARADREFWGRLVESAVGAHLAVKSGRAPLAHAGTAAFAQAFQPTRTLMVGGDGIALEEFLMKPVTHWIGAPRVVSYEGEESLDARRVGIATASSVTLGANRLQTLSPFLLAERRTRKDGMAALAYAARLTIGRCVATS